MKIAIIVFVILFVIAGQSVCYSEDTSNNNLTSGLPNGRAWTTWNKIAKTAYLAGLYGGALLLRDALLHKGMSDKVANETLTSMMDIPKATYEEIAKQIDTFYADSTNLNIPINRAFEVASHKFRGESLSKLEEYTAELRKFYNK